MALDRATGSRVVNAATWTVGHVNTHNTFKGVRVMRRHGCDSFGLNEANRLIARLLKVGTYRATYGDGARDTRRGARANVVMVRNRYPSWGTLTVQASERAAPAKWAPDRWITCVMVNPPRFGPLAHLSIHPNAVVTGRGVDVARVREYDEMMRTLDRVLAFVRTEGFTAIVSGDFNLRRHDAPEQTFTTPYEVFDWHRMDVRTEGIDGIAYGRDLSPIGGLRVLPRRTVGSDHPGLVLTLSRRRTAT